jgi:hypothetical protein
MTATSETRRGFTLTPRLDAPRHLVFQAWTDPDHLQWFFNPQTTPAGWRPEVDLRAGGAWRQVGWPQIDPARPQAELIATVELEEVGEKTEMLFRLDFPDGASDAEVRELLASGMREGWADTIDRLVAARRLTGLTVH